MPWPWSWSFAVPAAASEECRGRQQSRRREELHGAIVDKKLVRGVRPLAQVEPRVRVCVRGKSIECIPY